ncbi:universal stress protein [Kitasatospora phosalacinea]|uniref:Universal stress protein n=1 Tax=Kitasatospora phosalacinea TaxID=2065 RepID=A0A9W6PMG9_9ACTN|nr:universal stress protein [Kitasatospora phosalacinea]GLW57457.1 universal stress protein [Kitasatospora phosalacinea]
MTTENEGSSRIVAGVDGSPSARTALAWAVRQAELTGAAVDAVTAWQYPAGYGWPAPVLQSFDFAAAAGQALAEAVEAVATRHEGVEIRQHVVQDHPATALLAAADGAELLVVGNRGRGGFAGTLLGSVSQHCVHHARCPVVVVRTD